MQPQIVTIGAYNFTEEQFFRALREAHVDTFCDIRARRGLRGSLYAFANSTRLQQRLAEMGIRYLHIPELAPSQATRDAQTKADASQGVARRKRTQLSEQFVRSYEAEVLSSFDPGAFIERLGPEARVVCLFCVEGWPEACHRSLLAARLSQSLGVDVEHILPPGTNDAQ